MPIDPSIPLGIRPVVTEAPNPVAMMNLRQMMEDAPIRRQIQQETLRAKRLEIEQVERDRADQTVIQNAYAEAAGDTAKLSQLVRGRVSPKAQKALDDSILEAREKLSKLTTEQLTQTKTQTELVSNASQALKELKTPEERAAMWPQVLGSLVQGGAVKPGQLPEQYPGDEWLSVHANLAITADKQITNALNERQEVRLRQAHDDGRPKVIAEGLDAQYTTAARSLESVSNQAGWDEWRAAQPEAIRGRYPAMFSPAGKQMAINMGKTPHQLTQETQAQAQITATAERDKNTRSHQLHTEGYQDKMANAALIRANKAGESSRGVDEETVDANIEAVIANPDAWEDLSKYMKDRMTGKLHKKGFDFAKPISEAAAEKISIANSAIEQLNDLEKTIRANEQFMGPVKGAAAWWPWSKAKELQAQIDLDRQKIGKALEGGVLRKEDEEKYKKILAEKWNTPELAYSKIRGLVIAISRDVRNYKLELKRSGRRVDVDPPKGGAGGDLRSNAGGGGLRVGDTYQGGKITSVTRVD
jgi:hypothetical protein